MTDALKYAEIETDGNRFLKTKLAASHDAEMGFFGRSIFKKVGYLEATKNFFPYRPKSKKVDVSSFTFTWKEIGHVNTNQSRQIKVTGLVKKTIFAINGNQIFMWDMVWKLLRKEIVERIKQKSWMKTFIDKKTEMRAKANTAFATNLKTLF